MKHVSGRRPGIGASGQERTEELWLDALREQKRRDLLALAKKLGLRGVSKLSKEALAVKVHEAAAERRRGGASEGSAPKSPVGNGAAAARGDAAAAAKLDLGPAAGAAERPIEHIPWSYGQDRVTAMAVDPAKLFVYWEVTDPAIARAREQLGAGGSGGWLNLRVYDTSGRIFDGTNARSYFDHRVERHDRQWFFSIGKPTSTAHVEVGLKSAEGYFVRIARSGRVDFPRAEPVPAAEPEWLTVRAATGDASAAARGGPRRPRPAAPAGPGTPLALPLAVGGDGPQGRLWQILHGDWQRVEWRQLPGGAGWFELERRVEWEGPLLVSSWEAGPFTYPVTVEPPSREEWGGRSFAYRVGDVTHVVYGPWQVVIRNLGAHRERAEIARWEMVRSWVAIAGREVRLFSRAGDGLRAGASEALGASERLWIAGSELRLGGASEVWRLGASEIRMRGASETLFAGASQWILLGASERRLVGASEIRLGGASERHLGGASEARLGGGSEYRLAAEARAGGEPTRTPGPLPYPRLEG